MKISTKTTVIIGMFTAVISVLSILTIPMPSGVPITLQTFGIALGGYVLGYKKGALTTLIYILLGSIGIPVFAGMTGGVSRLVSYSGGFLWGFLFLVILCGASMEKRSIAIRIGLGCVGLLTCHLCGVIQFSMVTSCTLLTSFITVSAPYLIKDVLSVVGAYLVALPIRRAFQSCSR